MMMIVTGSVFTAWVSRDIAFPAILCMLGLLGLLRRFTWDLPPERRFITSLLLLVLAILFAMHYTWTGGISHAGHEQAANIAWSTITRYFLASMILILYLGAPQRLPPSLGFYHVATVVSAGQILLLDDLYMTFRLAELLAAILAILYVAAGPAAGHVARDAEPETPARSRRGHGVWPALAGPGRSRWIASAVILLVAANLGWVVSSVLYRHVEILNYVPLWLWRGGAGLEMAADFTARVGFSDTGELGSIVPIKGEQDTTPALRIMSDTSPGYLRARAFIMYRQSMWYDVAGKDAVFPSQNTPFGGYIPGRMNLFRLEGGDDSGAREMSIRHEVPIPDTIFAPLGTLCVEAPLNLLMHNDDDIVSPPQPRTNLSYRVTYTAASRAAAPSSLHVRHMLNLPVQLDPRVRDLAERIFTGCTTTEQKISAVCKHFQTHYTYSLGLPVAPDRDRLTYFLLEASTGYCEYFASGAAILLRLGDVPTRYVTGFFVTARDPDGKSWVARNMDAHAWVEAWDEQAGQWKIVEATVPEGLSTSLPDDDTGHTGRGGAYLLLGEFLDDLYEYGLFGVLAWTLQHYGLYAVSFLLAVSLAGTFWWAYRRARPRPLRRPAGPVDPQVRILHKMLARMDRRARASGLRRGLGETLQTFSLRLRARDAGDGLCTRAADWYLAYAAVRYDRTITPDRLDRLHQLATLSAKR
jgi:hypothetical protein